ncbi:MAG: arylesterase [Pseudomonadota bacterium]|nr:arylesterase [Pseudomonadota bacterium]
MRTLLALWLLGCGAAPTPVAAPSPSTAPAAPPLADTVPRSAGPRVVFLGDSLTAGLGLSVDQAFPARAGKALAERGLPVQVVNAGVSGDTSAGGLRRLDWILSQKPDVLVLALGANDMLRGLPPADCEANLRAIVTTAKAAGVDVLLLGMKANPTLGSDYVTRFDAIYPTLAAELGVGLVPFFLDGVAGNSSLNQPDGLHPTAAGQDHVTALILPALEPLVRARAASSGG